MYVIRRSDGALFCGYASAPGLRQATEPVFKKAKPGKPVAAFAYELKLEAEEEIRSINLSDKRACVAAFISD